jgi:hypothetical protein
MSGFVDQDFRKTHRRLDGDMAAGRGAVSSGPLYCAIPTLQISVLLVSFLRIIASAMVILSLTTAAVSTNNHRSENCQLIGPVFVPLANVLACGPSSYPSKAELRRNILLVYLGNQFQAIYMWYLQVLSQLYHSLVAIDYKLTRWGAFTRFLYDGRICLTTDVLRRGNRQHVAAAVASALDLTGLSFRAATIRS